MKINRSLFISGIFSLLAFLVFPLGAKAADEFSPTVKIVGYRYMLNGQVATMTQGSGTLIDEKGHVLTNAHVIMDPGMNRPLDAFSVCVSEDSQNPPSCYFTANLERYDEKIDLALLQINNDVAWGNLPAAFPYLPYNHGFEASEGDTVTVKGFSVSGGKTINTTQGQVSGFEQTNGYNYLKTDADIDAGNSGGTMLDSEGHFVGVPTYVVSYYETAGRALNISNVKTWMESGAGEKGVANTAANQKLTSSWKRFFQIKNDQKINFSQYPGLSVNIPDSWELNSLNDSNFDLVKDNNQVIRMGMGVDHEIFFDDRSIEDQLKAIMSMSDPKMNSEGELVTVNGKQAVHLFGSYNGMTVHMYFIHYGYAYINIWCLSPTNQATAIENELLDFINSLSFSMEAEQTNPQAITSLNDTQLPFSLSTPLGWKMLHIDTPDNNLLKAAKKINEFESLNISYSELAHDYFHAPSDEGMANQIAKQQEIHNGTVDFQSTDLIMDGQPGWIFIESYKEGSLPVKSATVSVLDPEYQFIFTYEADETIFDEGFKDFVKLLKNYKTKRYAEAIPIEWDYILDKQYQGLYNIPQPTQAAQVNLTDITGHRYEQSIRNLVAMGVINGNPDGTFRPEDPVNRAASLKIILQSLRAKQLENGEAPYVMPANFNKFPDVTTDLWYATYVAEGVDKGIIDGYPDGTFKGDQNVILAEALKMTLEAHKVSVWNGVTDPWYKKYFDAAHQLQLLPSDLQDPAHVLTRAELAYIVDQLVSQ